MDSKPRVLIFGGKVLDEHPIAKLLGDYFDADVVDSSGEAIEALTAKDYHGVFADVGDFLPLERAIVSDKASVILNTIGEGVCIVDADGRCAWSNKKMLAYPPAVSEQVRRICGQAHKLFGSTHSSAGQTSKPGCKKFTFGVDDRYFEMICSPVMGNDGVVAQIAAVVWDSTGGKRLQRKIDAIDASGRELAKLDADAVSKLTPPQRLKLLQEKIIKYSKDLMHFDHFAIRLLDHKTNKLEVVIAEGLPPEALEIDLYAHPEGNGVSGYVAATKRSYICHDTEKDPRYVLGLEHAKSSLTVPLMLFDEVVGVYNVEAEKVGQFNEDDRQFAEIFGRYVALAMNILNLLVVERYTTSGQITDSVIQEMTCPLNDILHECERIKDAYIGDEALTDGVARIITDVKKIREALDNVKHGPNAVIGSQDVADQKGDPLLSGKKVLVADDEPNIRKTIKEILTKHGCAVTTAKDGYEACTALDQTAFDMVVSDIKMPYRNGYEIYAAAQRVNVHTPVILMTGFGYDPHHSIVRASQEGLAAVLFKPFKVEPFLEEVRKALRESAENSARPQAPTP
ncbi:MAG: response regulator [Phycisphaerales bacterium JB063]